LISIPEIRLVQDDPHHMGATSDGLRVVLHVECITLDDIPNVEASVASEMAFSCFVFVPERELLHNVNCLFNDMNTTKDHDKNVLSPQKLETAIDTQGTCYTTKSKSLSYLPHHQPQLWP